MTNSNLIALSAASLVVLYNTAIEDYAPEGFGAVKRFKSKADGAAQIEALCAAGNLALSFDGDTATIVDAMSDNDAAPAFGDGKGKVRPWGFALASKAWLAANPRGTPAREDYRINGRRKAARKARKAERAAKEALHADAE